MDDSEDEEINGIHFVVKFTPVSKQAAIHG